MDRPSVADNNALAANPRSASVVNIGVCIERSLGDNWLVCIFL